MFRTGFESNILRFGARLLLQDNKVPFSSSSSFPTVDPTRKFVVSYFLVDDTILINQIPDENSGLVAGRFLLRSRIPRPKEEQEKGKDRLFYKSEDLYVGAVVRLDKDKLVVFSLIQEWVNVVINDDH